MKLKYILIFFITIPFYGLYSMQYSNLKKFDSDKSLMLSPDGKYLIKTNSNETNLIDFENIKTVKSFKNVVNADFSSDGKYLIIASNNNENESINLSVINLCNLSVLKTLKFENYSFHETFFSKDSQWLIVSAEKEIFIYKMCTIDSANPMVQKFAHTSFLYPEAIFSQSGDAMHVAIKNSNKMVQLYQSRFIFEAPKYDKHIFENIPISDISLSQKCTYVALCTSASFSKTLRIYNSKISTSSSITNINYSKDEDLSQIIFSPNEQYLAFLVKNRQTQIDRVDIYEFVYKSFKFKKSIISKADKIIFSNNSKYLCVASTKDQNVQCYDFNYDYIDEKIFKNKICSIDVIAIQDKFITAVQYQNSKNQIKKYIGLFL